MQRIIIADISSRCFHGRLSGHGFGVADSFVAALSGEYDVWVAGGPAYAQRYQRCIELPYNTEVENSRWEIKHREWVNMRALSRQCRHDTIILQSCAVSTAFAFLPLMRFDGNIYSVQYNTYALNSCLRRGIFAAARSKLRGIICPMEKIAQAYGVPACIIPDYIYSGNEQPSTVSFAEKKYDFGMVGIISRDKGFIEMAQRLKNTPYRVFIAGAPMEKSLGEELAAIAAEASNITLKLGYLSEEEYASSIAAARYCCLYYSGVYSEHSSGVIYDVLFRGVPIVGSRCASLKCIEEFGMGVCIDDLNAWDPDELMNETRYRVFLSNIRRYYQTHREYRRKLIEFIKN